MTVRRRDFAIRNAASFAIVEPEVKTDPKAQLAFIAMSRSGEVGAAALRLQKKVFRYALARGTTTKPALVDVKPML